jgi:hypothetical protein
MGIGQLLQHKSRDAKRAKPYVYSDAEIDATPICTRTSRSRRKPWQSSSRTKKASEPASALTIDCSPFSRRYDGLNYAEWSGDDVGTLDDGTATTTIPPGTTRHSLPGGIVPPMPRSA